MPAGTRNEATQVSRRPHAFRVHLTRGPVWRAVTLRNGYGFGTTFPLSVLESGLGVDERQKKCAGAVPFSLLRQHFRLLSAVSSRRVGKAGDFVRYLVTPALDPFPLLKM